MSELRQQTVDMRPNYENKIQEPVVLPAQFPNLLVNGTSGIAVGMATNIPPHNLREIVSAIVHLIDTPDATPADLRKYIKGPDFPTGGYIYGRAGIKDYFDTGRGRIVMRARAVIEKVAAMAKWNPGAAGGTGRGRGIAFARYKNRAAYSAVVVELSVDEAITLHHVWCATDAGLVINPDGVINQLEGGIIQAASWVLKEQVRFDNGVASFDWETYPVLKFSEVPEIDIELINTKSEVPLGAGEATGGPTAAAIGNAVSHALGARIREMPLTRERIMAALPGVRLAFSTGDRATIQDTASELWAKISLSNAIFLVTDPRGRPIASLGGKTPLAEGQELELVTEAAACFPDQASGFFYRNGELYQVSVTPVYIDSTRGPALLDVLVAGYQVDALLARELKERTNSEFVFVAAGRVVTSTLNPRATKAVVAGTGKARVSDGVVQYARFTETLADIGGKPVGEISILRSFEGAEERVASLTSNIVLLWLLAILVGLGITYAMARRIVEPVKQLDRAAAEVARQNYEIEVAVRGDDELGRLARTFNEMCGSIRQAREVRR